MASRRLQFATRFYERHARQPPRRFGFGTWALAAQLSVRSVGQSRSRSPRMHRRGNDEAAASRAGASWRFGPIHAAAHEVVRTSQPPNYGYTNGMKTAVSIPDEVFEKVERLARRSRKSRSEVFSAALREYVARHAPDEITESINEVCDKIGNQTDTFVRTATRRVLEKTEW
jgi:metal-responsive CopG/Arc/MetJ family transcriptional regulator